MCVVTAPASAGEALGMLASAVKLQRAALGFLAEMDAADMPAAVAAECLQGLEQADAVGAAARGQLLAAFDAQDGSVADGQRTARTWLVYVTRVTRGQAAEHRAVQALAEHHRPLLAGLREGDVITKSVALQLAKWTAAIPEEFREKAEQILVAAAQAGADLRALAAICAEIRSRTARPDPDDENDRHLDRSVPLDTTIDGAGVVRGDLTPGCAAMVRAVLDALAAPDGAGDLRTHPQRYHDALEEAMRRLLSSGLLPKRAGQPVKALVHIYFAELCEMDQDSVLQDKWIAGYRARWAAHRAAASVSTGDGGAWLEGDAAREVACDAMLVPVVTGDIDVGAAEDLIDLCARYQRIRIGTPDPAGVPGGAAVPAGLLGRAARQAEQAATVADALADLEHQILGKILQVVSGPGGVASFLRRNLLGKGLNGPSLPLDVGQP